MDHLPIERAKAVLKQNPAMPPASSRLVGKILLQSRSHRPKSKAKAAKRFERLWPS
jgi:hypothetical protein